MKTANSIDSWLKLEELYGQGRLDFLVPTESGFEATYLKPDAFRAEASALTEDFHPVVRARLLMERGNITEALAILEEASQGSDPELDEMNAAKVKALAISGEWDQAAELAVGVLCGGISALRKLELFQLLALCEFERNQFSHALHALRFAESIGRLFPNSYSTFYAKILRIKIDGRINGAASMRNQIDLLWQERVHANAITLDTILTLARLEVDYGHLVNQKSVPWAQIALWASRQLGDELYEGLALIELASRDSLGAMPAHLVPFSERFVRVKNEWTRRQKSSASKTSPSDLSTDESTFTQKFSHVVIARHKIALSAAPFAWKNFGTLPLMGQALEAIAPGPISKEDFYKSVWQLSNYNPERHDSLLRSTLFRIRKDLDLPVSSNNGEIIAPTILFCLQQNTLSENGRTLLC